MFQQNRVGVGGFADEEMQLGVNGRFTPTDDSGAHAQEQQEMQSSLRSDVPHAPATYDEPEADAQMKRSTEALVRADDDAEEDGGDDVTPRDRKKKKKKSKKKRRSDVEMTLVAEDGNEANGATGSVELPPLRTRASLEPLEDNNRTGNGAHDPFDSQRRHVLQPLAPAPRHISQEAEVETRAPLPRQPPAQVQQLSYHESKEYDVLFKGTAYSVCPPFCLLSPPSSPPLSCLLSLFEKNSCVA